MNWYHEAGRYFGGYPDNYLVFDLETQGRDPESPSTLPTQLGYALVADGELDEYGDYMLNWTVGPEAVDVAWFQATLADTQDAMARRGKPYHTTWEIIAQEGVEPVEGLRAFLDLFETCAANEWPVVAHNGYAYDRVLLEHCWRRIGMPHVMNVEMLVDTGLMEKCFRVGWNPPLPNSCPRERWYRRVSTARSRVKWSLDVACTEEYGLAQRHGLDLSQAHSAGHDAVVTHHLLAAMRERADQGPDASWWVDVADYVMPIGREKGKKLRDIGSTQEGVSLLSWYLRQPWFQAKYIGIAETIEAFFAHRNVSWWSIP